MISPEQLDPLRAALAICLAAHDDGTTIGDAQREHFGNLLALPAPDAAPLTVRLEIAATKRGTYAFADEAPDAAPAGDGPRCDNCHNPRGPIPYRHVVTGQVLCEECACKALDQPGCLLKPLPDIIAALTADLARLQADNARLRAALHDLNQLSTRDGGAPSDPRDYGEYQEAWVRARAALAGEAGK